jgi:hypothetical protein
MRRSEDFVFLLELSPMKHEVKGLYSQCVQFDFDIAKKSERALCSDTSKETLDHVEPGTASGSEMKMKAFFAALPAS